MANNDRVSMIKTTLGDIMYISYNIYIYTLYNIKGSRSGSRFPRESETLYAENVRAFREKPPF